MPKRSEQEPTDRRVYSIREVARQLKLGLNSTYNAAARGEIPCVRIGGRIFVPKAKFDKLFEEN